jgi:hypothetical protein
MRKMIGGIFCARVNVASTDSMISLDHVCAYQEIGCSCDATLKDNKLTNRQFNQLIKYFALEVPPRVQPGA